MQENEERELKMFEKMEKLTGRPSFGSKLSLVRQFMAGRMDSSDIQEEGHDTSHIRMDSSDEEDIEKDEASHKEGSHGKIDSLDSKIQEDDPLHEEDALHHDGNDSLSVGKIEEHDTSHGRIDSSDEEIEEDDTLNKEDALQGRIDSSDGEIEEDDALHKKDALQGRIDSSDGEIEEDNAAHDDEDENTISVTSILNVFMEAKKAFEEYKQGEEAKLKEQKMEMSKKLAGMSKLRTELQNLKSLNLDYTDTIRQLEEKLKTTNSEWSRKSNGWNLARTKLKERITELENKCKTLEEKVAKSTKSTVSNVVKSQVPPKPIKRIQFASEKPEVSKENEEPLQHHMHMGDNLVDKHELISKLDGAVEKVYPNGTRKLVCAAKNFTRTMYKNGDIKETRSDGSMHFFFATLGLRHYVYPNGLEMTTYKNGQIQRKNPDGTIEVLYPNSCVKVTRSDGKEEYIFPDNTVYQQDDQGNKTILLPNGQKEIHTELYKRRIFPDGTVKTVFNDGSAETKYSNGRIRVKSADGKLISDTQVPVSNNMSLSPLEKNCK